MNSPACEEGLEPAEPAPAPAQSASDPQPELVELGKVSQTQGGFWARSTTRQSAGSITDGRLHGPVHQRWVICTLSTRPSA